jgi:hypothetical protein
MFHKLRVLNCDAVERQKACMMSSLKKPHRVTICNHMTRCETMNGYITITPTLQDSSTSAVSFTKKGNIVAFYDATLAGIILAT